MDLASFLVGMVVAWIIALLIYWFGVQRDATDKIANTVPLNEHLAQVQDAEDRITQLQAELQERRHALEEAQAEREQLRAENEQLQVEAKSSEESLTPEEATPSEESITPEAKPTEASSTPEQALSPQEVPSTTEEAAPAVPSDLKRVEGIGPKIEEILNNAGIHTFQQLAESNVERLQTVLQEAGERYRMADPHTWPEQARLAAEEKWDELAALQDQLKGGR